MIRISTRTKICSRDKRNYRAVEIRTILVNTTMLKYCAAAQVSKKKNYKNNKNRATKIPHSLFHFRQIMIRQSRSGDSTFPPDRKQKN